MITRRTLAAAAAALGLLTQIPAVLAAADAKGDPETWVVEISNNILSRIKGDAKLAQADPALSNVSQSFTKISSRNLLLHCTFSIA